MNPEISIVVPLYNAEKYIAECIDSILEQTFEDFELIIVDDKSTDRSLEIVRNYRDPRIKIYQQIKNSGESSSRNFGLTVSSGKYVYFMDDDDFILPKCLETFFAAMEESNADVVYMNSYFETEDGINAKQLSCLDPTPRFFSNNLAERLQREYVNVGTFVTPWIKIQRRDFLCQNEILFPNVSFCGDIFFKLAELCFSRKTLLIDASGYVYRKHAEQTMNISANRLAQKAFDSMSEAVEYVHKIFSSPRLISALSDETKILLEAEVVFKYFRTCILKIYREKNLQRVDEFLSKILIDRRMQDPNVIKNFVHTLAMTMLQGGIEK